MKKTILLFSVLTMICSLTEAQNLEKKRRWHVGAGIAYNNFGSDYNILGYDLGIGYGVTKWSVLMFEITGGNRMGSNDKVGWYKFENENTGEVVKEGDVLMGVNAFSYVFTWNIKLKISEKSTFWIGPSVGGSNLTLKLNYKPSLTPDEQKKADEKFKTDLPEEATGHFGVNAEYSWEFIPRSHLNLGIRMMSSEKLLLNNKSTGGMYTNIKAKYMFRF